MCYRFFFFFLGVCSMVYVQLNTGEFIHHKKSLMFLLLVTGAGRGRG